MSLNDISTANIILTNQCNSKCNSCYYWRSKSHAFLDYKTVFNFLKFVKLHGASSVLFTGGEPTEHSELAKMALTAKNEFGLLTILSTNGINLSEQYSDLRNCIDSFCISFDSFSSAGYLSIRGIDAYQKILKAVSTIKHEDFPAQVWLGCLIQKKNFLDLIRIYNAAKSTGADGIFFNVPEIRHGSFGRQQTFYIDNDLFVPKKDLPLLHNIFNTLLEEDQRHSFLCQPPETFEKFEFYFNHINGPCAFPHRECGVAKYSITLTENGQIKPCFYLPETFNWDGVSDPFEIEEYVQFRLSRQEKKDCYNCNICAQFTPQ